MIFWELKIDVIGLSQHGFFEGLAVDFYSLGFLGLLRFLGLRVYSFSYPSLWLLVKR